MIPTTINNMNKQYGKLLPSLYTAEFVMTMLSDKFERANPIEPDNKKAKPIITINKFFIKNNLQYCTII